jgi:hypothetical protein
MTKEEFLKVLDHVKRAVEDDFVSVDGAVARINDLYASAAIIRTPAQIERANGNLWTK